MEPTDCNSSSSDRTEPACKHVDSHYKKFADDTITLLQCDDCNRIIPDDEIQTIWDNQLEADVGLEPLEAIFSEALNDIEDGNIAPMFAECSWKYNEDEQAFFTECKNECYIDDCDADEFKYCPYCKLDIIKTEFIEGEI